MQRINPEDTYRVSKKAWQRGGSTMFLKEGQRVKVKDLLKGGTRSTETQSLDSKKEQESNLNWR